MKSTAAALLKGFCLTGDQVESPAGSKISFSVPLPPLGLLSLLSSVSEQGRNSHSHGPCPPRWERGCLSWEEHSSRCQGKGCVKPPSGLQALASVLLSTKNNPLPSSVGKPLGREVFCKHMRCGSSTQRDQWTWPQSQPETGLQHE